MNMKLLAAALAVVSAANATQAESTPTMEQMWQIIQQQQAEIDRLKAESRQADNRIRETEIRVVATADAVDNLAEYSAISDSGAGHWADATSIGSYGEHHFNHFRDSDDQVDAHRYVLFLGHQFSDDLRFFSEFELEHGLVEGGDDSPGEVELEQAFIQWHFAERHSLVAGQFLLPVGILNETHEPDTFYGVERNQVETAIVPSTWWETGIMFQGELAPGFTYNAALHSGLAVDEGGTVRGGRQKSAKAIAEDLAYSLRLKYTGLAGLELATTLQYQSDITQGTALDESDALLLEAHAIYSNGPLAVRALWASWDIDGQGFENPGRDEQEGWYIEPSYRVLPDLGLFVRYSELNNSAGNSSTADTEIWDYGLNYWLHENVVVKADYRNNQDKAGLDNDSLNLGLGWSF